MAETFEVIQEVTVDVSKNIPAPTVFCKQADNVVRVLRVTIQDNKESYPIPAGFAARLRGTKSDGTRIYLDARSAAGNVAEFVLTQNALAADGKATCEVELSNSAGEKVKSCNLILNVQKSAMDDSAVESTDEFQSLDAAVKDAQEAKTAAETAATKTAADAESTKKDAATATAAAENLKDSVAQVAANATAVSQLKEDTDALKAGKISKFYASSQGDATLPDSDNGRLVDLRLYGKSSQQQYSGKSLFDIPIRETTSNGITFAKVGSNQLSVSGTATGNAYSYGTITADNTLTLPAGTYTFLCKSPANAHGYIDIINDDGEKTTKLFDDSTRMTFDAPVGVMLRVQVPSGVAVSGTCKIMIAKGTNTDWEPYVGGIPSPSPDYPQEIKSVVNPVVKVTGKNLLKPTRDTSTKNGVTCTANGDGTYTLRGAATATGIFVLCPNFDFAGKMMLSGGTSLANLQYSNSADFAYGDTGSGAIIEHFDAEKYPNASFNILIKSGAVYNDDVVKPMLTADMSTTYDDYMPYAETAASLPYTLNAIPVSSGGNVEISGQQYIADYIDCERGKLVRMVAEADVSKLTQYGADKIGTNTRYLFKLNTKGFGSDTPCMCKKLKYLKSYASDTPHMYTETDQIFIFTSDADFATGDYVIFYPIATPTEIDLTADEVAALKGLASYYPTTNIACTSDELDGHVIFDYPISLAKGYDYIKQQLGDTRDYLYNVDLVAAESYVNAAYAAALAELEVV